MTDMAEIGDTQDAQQAYDSTPLARAQEVSLDLVPLSLSPLSFDILVLLLFRKFPLTSKAIERQLQCAYALDYFMASFARLHGAPASQQQQIINKIASKVSNAAIMKASFNAYLAGGVEGFAAYLLTDTKLSDRNIRADVKRIKLIANINELTNMRIPSSTKIDTDLNKLQFEYLNKTTNKWQVKPQFYEIWIQRRKWLLREAEARIADATEQVAQGKLNVSRDDYLTEEEAGIKTSVDEVEAYVIIKMLEFYTPLVMDFYLLYVDKRNATQFESIFVRNAKYMRYFQ